MDDPLDLTHAQFRKFCGCRVGVKQFVCDTIRDLVLSALREDRANENLKRVRVSRIQVGYLPFPDRISSFQNIENPTPREPGTERASQS